MSGIVFKEIGAGKAYYLEKIGDDGWYYGSDPVSGDLYEAEELFSSDHPVDRGCFFLIRDPEGEIIRPVEEKKGRYFGRPLRMDEKIVYFYLDLPERIVSIESFDTEEKKIEKIAEVVLPVGEDAYNLFLMDTPLTLYKRGKDDMYVSFYPEEYRFPLKTTEYPDAREGDILVSTMWIEDPDYREETILRHLPDGEILERKRGTSYRMKDGTWWLLKQGE